MYENHIKEKVVAGKGWRIFCCGDAMERRRDGDGAGIGVVVIVEEKWVELCEWRSEGPSSNSCDDDKKAKKNGMAD